MKKKNTQDEAVIKIKVNVRATLRDAKTGKVKMRKEYHNLLPTVGRAAIANNLTDSTPSPTSILVDYCEVGTSATAPANGDTALGTAHTRTAVVSRTNANNIAYITGFFSATQAVATLREAGLFILGTATLGTGTLFSHVAINITKSATETLTLDWTVTIS